MDEHLSRPAAALLGMAMELCWLQAWAAFLFHSVFKYRTPVFFVLLIYGCGVMTHRFSIGRPRMRIQAFLIQVIGFGAGVSAGTWFFLFRLNVQHVSIAPSHLLDLQHSLSSWGFVIILSAISLTVWKRTRAHVINPLTLQNVYQRFDLGLAAFFSLLVIKLLCFARFSVVLNTPDLKYLFLPFFLFGLLAIGFILNDQNRDRNYVFGFQKMGVALSFAVVMLFGSLALALMFHGQLTVAAESLSGILQKAGPPLSRAVVWVARLLWASKRRSHEPPRANSPDDFHLSSGNVDAVSNGSWLTEAVKWGMTVAGILVLAVAMFLLLRWLIQFLMTRKDVSYAENFHAFDWKAWFRRFNEGVRRFLNWITRMFTKKTTALDFWTHLLSWGRRSGIVHSKGDTPLEYGSRLIHAYPVLQGEIQLIIDLIEQEVYGEVRIDIQTIHKARKAQRRMAHPRFWKMRLKTILFPQWHEKQRPSRVAYDLHYRWCL